MPLPRAKRMRSPDSASSWSRIVRSAGVEIQGSDTPAEFISADALFGQLLADGCYAALTYVNGRTPVGMRPFRQFCAVKTTSLFKRRRTRWPAKVRSGGPQSTTLSSTARSRMWRPIGQRDFNGCQGAHMSETVMIVLQKSGFCRRFDAIHSFNSKHIRKR